MKGASPDDPIYLVICKAGQAARVESHETLELALTKLKALFDQHAQVFIFQGERHHVSSGEWKYLVSADGLESFPLFDLPANPYEINECGWMCSMYEDPEEDEEEEPEEAEEEAEEEEIEDRIELAGEGDDEEPEEEVEEAEFDIDAEAEET